MGSVEEQASIGAIGTGRQSFPYGSLGYSSIPCRPRQAVVCAGSDRSTGSMDVVLWSACQPASCSLLSVEHNSPEDLTSQSFILAACSDYGESFRSCRGDMTSFAKLKSTPPAPRCPTAATALPREAHMLFVPPALGPDPALFWTLLRPLAGTPGTQTTVESAKSWADSGHCTGPFDWARHSHPPSPCLSPRRILEVKLPD